MDLHPSLGYYIKRKMKYITKNGEVYEGTPEEILNLKSQLETEMEVKVAPVVEIHIPKTRVVKHKYKSRTDWISRIAIVAEVANKHPKLGLGKILSKSKIPSGSSNQIRDLLKIHNKELYNHFWVKSKGKDIAKASDVVRDRAKFISTRAASLMKINTSLTREYAWARAAEEYNIRHGRLPQGTHINGSIQNHRDVRKSVTFPEIYPVCQEDQYKVCGLLKNKFLHGNRTVKFMDAVETIKNTESIRWNGILWHQFLQSIINNQIKILKYFNVTGEFKVEYEESFHEVLVYYPN